MTCCETIKSGYKFFFPWHDIAGYVLICTNLNLENLEGEWREKWEFCLDKTDFSINYITYK